MITALRVPEDGDPEVLTHERWRAEDIATALSLSDCARFRLEWQPAPGRFFVLSGPNEGSRNLAALALAGEHHGWLFGSGPLLVTAHTRTWRATSLTRLELLLIGTRLLVGEASQRALVAPK